MDRSRAWRLPAIPAAAVLLAVAMLGCGGRGAGGGGGGGGNTPPSAASPSSARFKLRIGDLVPLSGQLASFGPPGRKAAELALQQDKQALREAGVKGVTVNLDQADSGTDSLTSVNAARGLVRRGDTCVAGPWASADTIAVAQQVAEPEQVPMISPASTSAQITTLEDSGYTFRTAPSNNLQAETLAGVVKNELGGTDKTISIAGRNDAYGQGLVNGFRRAWEARGGKTAPSGPVLYDPNQADFSDEAQRIVADKPDGYVIVDFPDGYARLGQALLRTGQFDAGKLFVTDGLAGAGLPQSIPGKALQGARGIRPATPTDGPDAKAFDRLYSSSKLKPKDRQQFDAQNFDATNLCFLAAVAAGSNQGSAIQSKIRDVASAPGRQFTFQQLGDAVKALRSGQDIDYQGASGPVDLDGDGDPLVGTYDVFQFGKNRSFRVLRQVQARQGQGEIGPPPGAGNGAPKSPSGGGGKGGKGSGGKRKGKGGGGR